MARGELIGCFGLTEAEGGSDPAAMRTKAEKVDGGYTLNGAKYWISNSPIADLAIVWAKLDGDINGFIVERAFEGFSTHKIGDKLSLRASITGDIGLTDVFVPDANRLPNVRGLRGPFSCLNKARYGIAWGAMGAAEFCFHATRDYVAERSLFGKPLAGRQLVQKKLAEMMTSIALGLEGCLALGRLLDADGFVPEAISMMKRENCTRALAVAREARDMHGGAGITGEMHVMRHAINLEDGQHLRGRLRCPRAHPRTRDHGHRGVLADPPARGEGGERGLRLRRRETRLERVFLCRHSYLQGVVIAHQPLGHDQGAGREGGELVGHRHRLFGQRAVGDDVVGQAPKLPPFPRRAPGPRANIAKARWWPMRAGSSKLEPASGTTPSPTKGAASRALSPKIT